MKRKNLLLLLLVSTLSWLTVNPASAQKAPVFIYAGQSNADGRENVKNLPDYMKAGTAPYSPYTYLKYASICGNPSKSSFETRTFAEGTRYAFCDVANYWIEQALHRDFYAIKCAYGGTAIAPGVTAEKLPIWYADSEWMQTHYAYKGDDITQPEYANNNSLTKNLTEGFASLVDGTLAALDNGYDVKAIMWHQGESDRSASGNYYENFKTMIAYMRQAIYNKTGDEADKTLPFIFGTVCRRSTQYNATVEEAQKRVAAEDPNCYVIDMKNATLLSDNLHFDRQATEYLGKKMYNLLVELALVEGQAVEVEEFPVKESVMDGVEVPDPDNRSWDLTSYSQETKDALTAEVALSSGTLWNQHKDYGYRRGNGMDEEQLHTSSDYVIPETKGLYFSSPQGNRVALHTSKGYMVFVTGDPTMFVPKLIAGQLVSITAAASKNTIRVKLGQDMDEYAEVITSDEVGTGGGTVTFRIKYNVTLPTHIGFQTSGAAHIKKIEVKTPETVNVLIGADQIETFASDKPLDFSPFTDLFKAYVVTGFDDATGKIDLEQVLQVPANTGLVLMGEESTVNVPVIEGDAPVLAQTNLLTSVVGEGSAPADSYVLTTSQGATQFTKATTAKSLNNQAYISTLGSLSTYGFNPLEPKKEHVYNFNGTAIAKGSVLSFTDVKHHTTADGKDVYSPSNATGLDGRFAFDNSGEWQADVNNGTLGQLYLKGKSRYLSVVSLTKGDRISWEAYKSDGVTLKVLNNVLRNVDSGTVLTNGETYVIESSEGELVNLDLIVSSTADGSRQGITKITVWTSTETTPIYTVSTPKANVELQPVRDGLYKPVATLSVSNIDEDAVTYYYKGGEAADWTALSGNTFEPARKAEYQFKAASSGFADSGILTLALGYRYSLGRTVVDLTDETVFTASTKDESGFNWKDASNVMISGLPSDQVFGHIKNNTAIAGISVQNSNLDTRYSFAKGIGLACNYGYYVNTTTATAYDFAEYEVYQPNKSITEPTEKVLVHNPNTDQYKFKPLKAVRLYEPVDVANITISDIGYATYCSEQALDFTGSGVEAFYATADGDDVNFSNPIDNPAAGTGLLLKAAKGSYEVLVAGNGTDVSGTNLLQSNFETKTVGVTTGCDYGKVFILSKHDGKVGFFKANNGRELQAGKSYLYIESPSEVRSISGFLFDKEATGIDSVLNIDEPADNIIYNLQGQRVTSPGHGIYIVNGKKTFIK